MAEYISKVTLPGGGTYNIKDAEGRTAMSTLVSSHTGTGDIVLGTAAWHNMATAISDTDGKIADAATVKAYVDAQIGTIHKFDVVVVDELPTASAATMYKIYLVPTPGAEDGSKDEYITIRSGEEGSYTYAWEMIGSTKPELEDYVKKVTKIANVEIGEEISVEALSGSASLNLKALSHADTASGSGTASGTTIQGVEFDYTPAGTIGNFTVGVNNQAEVTVSGSYTPAGTITGNVVTGGEVEVELEDGGASTTSITYDGYTPEGTVSLEQNDTGSFQVAGTNQASSVTFAQHTTKSVVTGLTAGETDAATINTNKFSGGSFTGATQASFTQGTKASFTQGTKASFDKGTAIEANTDAIKVNQTVENETLVFVAATKHEVIGHSEATFTANGDDTFTANGNDTFTANAVGTFTPASISDGFLSAQKIPVAAGFENAITALGEATAAAQTFVGKKYAVAFTGEEADVKATAVEYLKPEIKKAEFTPTTDANSLTFGGTAATINAAGTYTAPTGTGSATFTGTAGKATGNVTVPNLDVTVTVTPDEE